MLMAPVDGFGPTEADIALDRFPRMPTSLSSHTQQDTQPGWSAARIVTLLKGSVEEIEKEQPCFFGSLKIEVNYRHGEIETVIVNRRQTLKD
jgi:hypothetical protein